MPVQIQENIPVLKASFQRSLAESLALRVQLPAWSIVALAALTACVGFAAGRKHPAHHYVSYFGYPLVMDTATGKACYAVPPKPSTVQDAAYPVDGTANPLDTQSQDGPPIPLCGQE